MRICWAVLTASRELCLGRSVQRVREICSSGSLVPLPVRQSATAECKSDHQAPWSACNRFESRSRSADGLISSSATTVPVAQHPTSAGQASETPSGRLLPSRHMTRQVARGFRFDDGAIIGGFNAPIGHFRDENFFLLADVDSVFLGLFRKRRFLPMRASSTVFSNEKSARCQAAWHPCYGRQSSLSRFTPSRSGSLPGSWHPADGVRGDLEQEFRGAHIDLSHLWTTRFPLLYLERGRCAHLPSRRPDYRL